MEKFKKIPAEKYKEILDLMPICCVDFIIKKDDKILLVRRKNKPMKGLFWLPGGRIYKNERFEDAVKRKALEECGLKVKIDKKLLAYDFMNKDSPFDNLESGVHSISIVFLVSSVDKDPKIALDSQSSDYKWAGKTDKEISSDLMDILKEINVF